jgi:hypothetical protein
VRDVVLRHRDELRASHDVIRIRGAVSIVERRKVSNLPRRGRQTCLAPLPPSAIAARSPYTGANFIAAAP